MRTNGHKNALLSAFIVALLLTSAALPILGLVSLTSASSSDAQILTEGDNSASTTSYGKAKLEGFDKTAGKWSTGNLDGWKELDWVPYRIKFSSLPKGTSSYTFNIYHNNLLDDKDGVDRLRGFRVGDEDNKPVKGSVTVSGPSYKTYGKGDQDIYYTITVSFTTEDPGLTRCLYWQAHLAFGASGWPGASLHAYTDISGKGSVSINVPPTPVGSISGYKWNDANDNGVWDLDENGLSDWTIQLYRFEDNAWTRLAKIYTDSAGAYNFSLVAGKYRLCEVLKDNWVQTFPLYENYEITLSEGESKSNINFGNYFLAAMRNVEVSISPEYKYQEGLPGGTVEYTVNVRNMGSLADIYNLSASDNAGWGPTISPTTLSLSAGENGTATVSVTIPKDAVPCTEDNILVIATSQADSTVSDNDSCIAHAEEVKHGVEVSISPGYQSALPGATLSYTVTVKNTGNVKDNYSLSENDDAVPSWEPTLYKDRLEDVPPDENKTTTLNVTIPGEAVPSTDDNITVTATSQENTQVSDNASCIAHATGAVPPSAPTPKSPADGTITNDNTPTFEWTIGANADNHRLLVDNDPDFSSPEENRILLDNYYTIADENSLPDENYSWKAIAINTFGENGSSTWTFLIDTIAPATPTLGLPENNAVENALTQIFTWSEPEAGATYDIQIDNETSFTPPYVHENTGRTDNLYTYTFASGGVYYWRVRAVDAATNQSSWADYFKLTIQAPPGQPTLYLPTDGALTNDNNPTFEWIVGTSADNHRLLVDNDADFSSPEENVLLGATDNTYTLENSLPDDNYSWKVIAINALGEDQSPVWTFVIDTVPPGAPSLGSPPDGTTTDDNTPTFNWENVPDAENYDFLINGIQVTISVSTYTLTVELPDGTHYWKVRARDAAGNVGEWSSTWTLIIQTITRGVEVSISPGSKSEAPGETLSYTVTVKNKGTVSDTYTLTATDSAGWGPTLSRDSLELAPQASGTATLTVTIPSGASLGAQDTITITAKSTTDPTVSDSVSCTAQAMVQMGVEVSISPESKSGSPEETITYGVTVKNTGSIDDTYTMSAVGAEGWSVSIEPTSLILAAGATGDATLSVVVPPDASENDSMTVTVTAISETYPSVTGSDTCMAVVRGVPVAPGIGLAALLAILALLILLLILLAYLLRRRRKVAARHRVLRSVWIGLGAPVLAVLYLLRGRRKAQQSVFRDASPRPRRWIGDRDC